MRHCRVAYIVSLFPCWSETFIAEEIQQLLTLGFDVPIFSLRPACEKDVHPTSLELLPRTSYAPSWKAILSAQFHFLFKKPGVYLLHFFRLLFGEGYAGLQRLKTLATFFIAACFARTIEESQTDRIHAHWATFGATAAWTVSVLTGIPFSFTTHAHDLFLPDDLLPKKIQAASFVVTISEFNRKLLHDKYAAQGKVHIVHCGVDARKFPAIAEYNWKGRRLLAVGRLVPIKGFSTLVRACSILKTEGIEFDCEIVGDGPLASTLKSEVRAGGLTNSVRLTGFASQDEVRAKLAEATVFVMPSEETKSNDRDGIPVALMEAMSMGIPAVSTFVSGIPELIESGISGLLVPAGDASALAKAIDTLLRDRDRALALAAQGKTKVQQAFDIRVNARRLAALFSSGT